MEPLVLGFSSGLVCATSCGPVVLPWLASERRAWRATSALLGSFLFGRLAGYLGFGAAAWIVGQAVSTSSRRGVLLFAVAHLALAAALVAYVVREHRGCQACSDGRSRRPATDPTRRRDGLAAAALGMLTGLSPCPPFMAAGVRAAERHSLTGALLFFALFFVGTSVWFAPFTAVAALRRFDALATVARLTTLAVAAYYGYLGAVGLGGAMFHG